jgi:hypothetical protein
VLQQQQQQLEKKVPDPTPLCGRTEVLESVHSLVWSAKLNNRQPATCEYKVAEVNSSGSHLLSSLACKLDEPFKHEKLINAKDQVQANLIRTFPWSNCKQLLEDSVAEIADQVRQLRDELHFLNLSSQ